MEVREALEQDIPGILEIFHAVYGEEYPYTQFYDPTWLKRAVFGDDILMLAAVEGERVLGTASVVFDVGTHSDLIGECGRLAVHPDARGRGVGLALMNARVDAIEARLHVAIVENRTAHPYSQRISLAHGFVPVGFLPLKHNLLGRESIALYARHFGDALSLRRNHPRVIPEAAALAEVALRNCGLEPDAIVDEGPPHPYRDDFAVSTLDSSGLPKLLRIARGRVRNRQVFGPMRLHYGLFKLEARSATYLLAHEGEDGPLAGAIGFVYDPIDAAYRVFELIPRSDDCIRFLFGRVLADAEANQAAYLEVDVSAYAPALQRTLVELGFVPAAYVPALAFREVERLDVVKMVRCLAPLDGLDPVLAAPTRPIADVVIPMLKARDVLPRIAEAVSQVGLFQGLSHEQTQVLAGLLSLEHQEADAVLFKEGEPADRMYVVLGGSVRIEHGGTPVGTVPSGDVVGETALLTGEDHHTATAVCTEAAELAPVDSEHLFALVRRRPDIGVVIFRNLAVGLGMKLRQADQGMLET